MRIVKNRLERISSIKSDPSKVFLMMEGTDTEPLYFKELFSDKSDIEYLPFERSGNDLGWSNPLLLMHQLEMELGGQIESLSYQDFLPFLVRYLKNNNPILDTSIFKREFNSCLQKKHIKLNSCCDETIIEDIFESLKTTSFIDLIYQGLEDVKKDFSNLLDGYYYDKDIDEIVLVVDRDKNSFSENQFDKVVSDGYDNNISIYVTNPCFEFFLGLHLSDYLTVDKAKLIENAKTNGITFAHQQLLQLDPGYTKYNYDVQKYISNIDNAILNLNNYEQKLENIKTSVGSNLATFLKKYK